MRNLRHRLHDLKFQIFSTWVTGGGGVHPNIQQPFLAVSSNRENRVTVDATLLVYAVICSLRLTACYLHYQLWSFASMQSLRISAHLDETDRCVEGRAVTI